MKRLLVLATAFTLAASASQAQTATSETTSNANNTANQISASGAIAGSTGNQVYVDNRAPSIPSTQTVRQSGSSTTRIEAAPALGGLAVGGGHPCAYTPGSAQLSIIGGGLGGAQMQIDEACMLAVMAAASGSSAMQQAALAIIGGRDPAACKAMYQQGLVADCLDRRGKSTVRAEPVVSTRNASAPTAPKLFSSCRYDQAKNQIMVKYTAAGRKDKTTAALACQRSLGM